MVYRIKLEQFEGPLDLLLQLTEQEKLDITRLSLAQVADQYLEYIRERESISLENLSEFLSIAAKLILIKSKALLPLLEFTEEEEEEIRDLELQLAMYKKFKAVAGELAVLADSPHVAYGRERMYGMQRLFFPPENIATGDLQDAFLKILKEIPQKEQLDEELIREVLTLEDKIVHLQDVLKKKIETSFAELVAHTEDTIEVVISFLAMLELVKQRIIHVDQQGLFGDIRLKHKTKE